MSKRQAQPLRARMLAFPARVHERMVGTTARTKESGHATPRRGQDQG